MPKRQLQLLGTAGCHLCEVAESILAGCLDFSLVEVEYVDIADSDGLVELYGVKIPVLRCPETQKVLCWPFDAAAAVAF